MAADILIVDDEADIRELIAGILQDEGFETRLAHNSDAAISELTQRKPSLVVLDIWLQGSRMDGLDLLVEIKNRMPDVPVVIISGHGNIETAVAAIRRGAYDYIEKPFNADRLLLIVGRALETTRLKRENDELRGRSGLMPDLVGNSVAVKNLRLLLKKVAPSNSRVLITGPMGAGKELVARTLHAMSSRAEGPFITLAAATMDADHLEESLFGVDTGGDNPPRIGALEEAHGGTLYLDEVSDMPLETQGKVLRVLLDQTFQRVGTSKKTKVDVRIISSTSRDLQQMIAAQQFREDLYHRLGVVPVNVPGLSERREDIPDLIEYFAKTFSTSSGQPLRRFAGDALAVMQTRNWPGNVRELRNIVERIMILTTGEATEEIAAAALPAEPVMADSANSLNGEHLLTLPLREAREAFERNYIAAQLSRFGGNISRASQFIGMERSALHRKIKSLGLFARDEE
jgi:two-component system, NtrC family, nitrogen regulation response regulator NtrX